MSEKGFPEIPVFDLRMEQEDLDAVEASLRSGWLTAGPRTAELEKTFAEHIGVRHAVAVSSCTTALHLAYLAAGVGPGDEVIVPSFTFAATASAVLYCGGRPVFADILGLDDPSIDPSEVERLVTPRTKAVVAVHFGGYAAHVDELSTLCEARGLHLIEDAAHTPSATLNGRMLGSFGFASAFSLFSNKVLPVGEGGLLTTDSDEVAALARSLRSHAMTRDSWGKTRRVADSYDVDAVGYNYRFDDARSALCLSRLRRLDAEMEQRRALTFRYRELLRDVDGLIIPYTDDGVRASSGYVMAIFLQDPDLQGSFREQLLERGVQTSVFYPPIHLFTAYRALFEPPSLPKTELAGRTAVMLPMYGHLTHSEQDLVVEAVKEVLA